MVLPGDPAIPLLSLYPEKNKNSTSKRHMHANVHSSTIYNSQDMETTQVLATDNWLGRCGVHMCMCARAHTHTHTHIHDGMLAIKKNEILPFGPT